jgi:glycosyl-4,4'-diaponeurosporenoate acyltransferase
MQIIFLEPLRAFVVDVIAWLVLHLSIGYLSSKIPMQWLNPDHWLFQTFKWEQGGKIYEFLFKVRSWKGLIPNGSALYKGAFSIKNIPTRDPAYLDRWLRESVRAEICHWMMVIPGFFFFLWNNVTMGWAMLIYAVANNFVPIVAQRFNRPRIRRFLAHAREREARVAAVHPAVTCDSAA